MSKDEQKQLTDIFETISAQHQQLMDKYAAHNDTLPPNIRHLSLQTQKMHRRMGTNHQRMMATHQQRKIHDQKMQMGHMRMHMENHRAGEWYQQMRDMYSQMQKLHQQYGQEELALMNKKMADHFKRMQDMVPGLNQPTDIPFSAQSKPSKLNGNRFYVRDCASCHGENGQGIEKVYPPVINSKWITAEKSIPIRIVLHGVRGEVEVQGKHYDGVMPSFKARLSGAEIAAILNFLRKKSDDNLSKITQQDVLTIDKKYSNRSHPWSPDELMTK